MCASSRINKAEYMLAIKIHFPIGRSYFFQMAAPQFPMLVLFLFCFVVQSNSIKLSGMGGAPVAMARACSTRARGQLSLGSRTNQREPFLHVCSRACGRGGEVSLPFFIFYHLTCFFRVAMSTSLCGLTHSGHSRCSRSRWGW